MMQKIGVVGAGTIGLGVAQSAAESGFEVLLVDSDPTVLKHVHAEIRDSIRLSRLMNPGRYPTSPDVLNQVKVFADLSCLIEAKIIIENIKEDWEAKRRVYEEMDSICSEGCIFAANTSAIPITKIASITSRPSLVLGMHFMNPVPLKGAVEVIRGFHTSEATLARAVDFLAQLGKRSILVDDSPGFVSNRVLMLTINEAINLVHERVASAEQVDDIFTSCFEHKLGPLATADLIGLDTILDSLRVLHDNFRQDKFRPSVLLMKMVDAGLLGCKSGQGFYRYPLGSKAFEDRKTRAQDVRAVGQDQ